MESLKYLIESVRTRKVKCCYDRSFYYDNYYISHKFNIDNSKIFVSRTAYLDKSDWNYEIMVDNVRIVEKEYIKKEFFLAIEHAYKTRISYFQKMINIIKKR